ncbi:gluconeogenesis factor YvcK family protein [Mycoplasmoides pirum]|uniref:gluconeogenesis factor YvcK family protein n=1 Tax=Mycoplasmoides pirum TaxID=2122 RepID=UPI0009DDC9E9|nr:2-phospho-L-lactate transferase CofD family protein [Mycoplasmoides pirum]
MTSHIYRWNKKIGEHKIPNYKKRIDSIKYVNSSSIKTNPKVFKKIANADYIVISTGSLYTSIIPNLIAPGIKEAIIKNNKAKVIYVANIMTQNGETHDMSLYDHVIAIEKHLSKNIIQTIIAHKGKINKNNLKSYSKQKCFPILIDENNSYLKNKLFLTNLVDNHDKKYIRHDPKKLEKIFMNFLNKS